MNIFIGIAIPFMGTVLGSACVYILKKEIGILLNKCLLGFASGVMVAASIWSLLIPSMDMSKNMGKLAFVPASVGFGAGIIFLLLLDSIIPHLHLDTDIPEGIKQSKLKNTTMLILAVTMHNIPEGMAVGIVFAGAVSNNNMITLSGALALSIGIAIQNFPEGAIISLPLRSRGISKNKAFIYGALSGVVEPIGSVLTIISLNKIINILPYLLSFAAGAMIYVVVEELIPESAIGEHSNISTIGFAIGFIIMMILDVALT